MHYDAHLLIILALKFFDIKKMLKKIALILFIFSTLFSEEKDKGYPFQFSYERDVPLLAGGIGIQLWGHYQLISAPDIQPYENRNPLFWDKPFEGTYNELPGQMSNYFLGAAIYPLWIYYGADASENRRLSIAKDLLLLSEVLFWSSGLNLWVRSSQLWSRPLRYSDEPSDEIKNKAEATGSFYSGHAANSFAVATFLSYTFKKKYPNHKGFSSVVWSSYGLASLVSVLRVSAGKHYPTDIVAGAAIGSFFGWFVPWLHESNAVQMSLSSKHVDIHIRF